MHRIAATCLRALAIGGLLVAAGAPAFGQDRDSLRARQDELYQQMLTDPTNAELMVSYARVSVELDDYDAAIATLERALIYEPDEPVTHLELGVAYFRIGSYQIADYHLGAARSGGLPGDLDSRAALYQEEIAARTETSRLSGVFSAGLAYASNANLGPKDEVISFFGLPAIIPGSATAQGDVGARATLGVRHIYDLGGANLDALVSELGVYSLHFFDETDGDVDVIEFATGPRLSLDESAYGPKIRPFLNLGYARVANDTLYTEAGVGVELTYPMNDTLTAFAELGLDRREFTSDFSPLDSYIVSGEIGGSARVARGFQVSGGLFALAEFTDDSEFDNQEIGIRGAFAYSYAPGIDMIDGLWTLSGHARAGVRYYDVPNAVVDPNRSRDDEEFRIGLAHLFRIKDGFGVRVDADYFNRSSNIPNFDFDNVTGAVSVVYEF